MHNYSSDFRLSDHLLRRKHLKWWSHPLLHTQMNKHRAYFLLLLPDMCVNLFPGIYSFLFLRTSLLVLLDENTENKKIGSFGLVSGEMRFFFSLFWWVRGGNEFNRFKIPEKSIPKDAAYQIINDELMLDGTPRLNLASFVTTWMEPECDKLIMASLNKNYVDMDEYPVTTELQVCVCLLWVVWCLYYMTITFKSMS